MSDEIERFIAFYEGSGTTNLSPVEARAELARLRAIEAEYEAVIQDDQERARSEDREAEVEPSCTCRPDEYCAADDCRGATIPTVAELKEVVANHVMNVEPMATSHGVAAAVHAFLIERTTHV